MGFAYLIRQAGQCIIFRRFSTSIGSFRWSLSLQHPCPVLM
ncbi:hypothetical protein HMPREF1988_01862 [Porphyromonas gingivalis F0185]|nr:hypothetical protein HMPREF1553_01563 [Porphyromonas gingivalis F0568]ERJ81689.1 hypothetical protein HMPREF1988_01862 [Porphyromonas gingivalis F0185]